VKGRREGETGNEVEWETSRERRREQGK